MSSEDKVMNPKHRGLGRGLNALFEDEEIATPAISATAEQGASAKTRVTMTPDQLVPNANQPRQLFKDETLNELANSIKEHGILQPLLVRPIPGEPDRYQIIAGERRWRASQLAQVHELPVIITDHDDMKMQEIALIENLQREDLNPIDEAAGYQYMIDEYGYTQDHLAKKMGKSRSHIANMLRLNVLPSSVAASLAAGDLSMGHARSLITLDNAREIAEKVVAQGLSVRETERLVAQEKRKDELPDLDTMVEQAKDFVASERVRLDEEAARFEAAQAQKAAKPEKDPDTIALEQEISLSLGMEVVIDAQSAQAGELKISYKSLDQLDDILAKLSATNPVLGRLAD